MKPKDKAKELVDKYYKAIHSHKYHYVNEAAKQCAIICVQQIINANPYSNPLNTRQYSTMDFWNEVLTELNNMP